NLVVDKFIALTVRKPLAGYTRDYFDIQLEIIRLLLDHRLFMQAFTVMRELIGSVGLIQEKKSITSCEGKRLRRKAELFIRMVSNEKSKWQFNDDENKTREKLMPLFSQLESTDVEPELRSFVKELTDYRNGFDHAWTSKNGSKQDIEDKGKMYFQKLESVINRLIELKMI
ncbi:MAG: TM1812 family CRISPR-associated protein, partial [Desulfatirhabdiaceae bacterium]|nr:TM1812 family CRISPR-associated protein [Desulfatirhabdiaceae bacterium]